MSTKAHRKDALKAVDSFPEPKAGESIIQIVGARGNNLYDVRFPNGEICICSMPTRFRRTIWIKRNDYAIVERINDGGTVVAEIAHILGADQIRHLHKQNLWSASLACFFSPFVFLSLWYFVLTYHIKS